MEKIESVLEEDRVVLTPVQGYHDTARYGGNTLAVLKRDNYQCVFCGITYEEHLEKHKRAIAIDHIDGQGTALPKNLKNNDIANLRTVCLSCHAKKHVHEGEVLEGKQSIVIEEIDTGNVYSSMREASEKTNYSYGKIRKDIHGVTKRGVKFREIANRPTAEEVLSPRNTK